MPTDNERRKEEQLRKERELIAAAAKHGWERHQEEFEKRGIKSEQQLEQQIHQVVNNPQTRSFKGQPGTDKQFPREIHVLRQPDESRSTVVILDENKKPDGQVTGGTAYTGKGNKEKQLLNAEMRRMGWDKPPELAIGGRPALQEREKHRQIEPVHHQRTLRPRPTLKLDKKDHGHER